MINLNSGQKKENKGGEYRGKGGEESKFLFHYFYRGNFLGIIFVCRKRYFLRTNTETSRIDRRGFCVFAIRYRYRLELENPFENGVIHIRKSFPKLKKYFSSASRTVPYQF